PQPPVHARAPRDERLQGQYPDEVGEQRPGVESRDLEIEAKLVGDDPARRGGEQVVERGDPGLPAAERLLHQRAATRMTLSRARAVSAMSRSVRVGCPMKHRLVSPSERETSSRLRGRIDSGNAFSR